MQAIWWDKKRRCFEVTVGRGSNRAKVRTQNRDESGRLLSKREQQRQVPACIDEAWAKLDAKSRERPQRLTVFDFCKLYARPEINRLSDYSWSRERRYKVAHIMSVLGHHDLAELSTGDVATWVHDLEGRYKTSTVDKYVNALKALYSAAEVNGYIEARRWKVRTAPIAFTSSREMWTEAQTDALIETARRRIDEAKDDRLRRRRVDDLPAARFLVLTGARPVEVMRMKWADVDERQALLKGKRRGKTGEEYRPRWLPLVDDDGKRTPLGELFAEMERGDGFVFFPTIRTRTWPAPRWRALCKAAEAPSTSAYDLRHTSITRMLVAGHSIVLVAEWHGTSVEVIQSNYKHLLSDHLRGLV